MDAAQFVDFPDYAAILFRKTFADLALPGALMDRAFEWWANTDARWIDKTKTWHFPSGATISFGYLDGPRDHFRYQSSEFQYVGFDEGTQFEEAPAMYLHSRLRRKADSGIPIKFRMGSNPGGIGHQWIYDRYIVNQNSQRIFIPALLQENPHLDTQEYEESLENLDEVTKAQLLRGLWITDPKGKPFKRHWWETPGNRYDPFDPALRHKVVARYAAFDTANKKNEDNAYTAVAIGEMLPDYRMVLRYVHRERKDFAELIDYISNQVEPWDYDLKMREIAIEDAASGTQALQVIPVSADRWLASRVRPYSGARSKEEEWEAASLWCARGMVLLPHPADNVPWLREFEDEIFNVPDTTFKDQADAFSILINYVEETTRSFSTRWRAMRELSNRERQMQGIAGLAGNPNASGIIPGVN